MLPPKLQEVKDRLESKSAHLRNSKENQLLQELQDLDDFLRRKSESDELRESVRKNAQITSGPGGSCPCCGR